MLLANMSIAKRRSIQTCSNSANHHRHCLLANARMSIAKRRSIQTCSNAATHRTSANVYLQGIVLQKEKMSQLLEAGCSKWFCPRHSDDRIFFWRNLCIGPLSLRSCHFSSNVQWQFCDIGGVFRMSFGPEHYG